MSEQETKNEYLRKYRKTIQIHMGKKLCPVCLEDGYQRKTFYHNIKTGTMNHSGYLYMHQSTINGKTVVRAIHFVKRDETNE